MAILPTSDICVKAKLNPRASPSGRLEFIDHAGRITGNPEVISLPVGLVPTKNALIVTGAATFRVPAVQKLSRNGPLVLVLHICSCAADLPSAIRLIMW
jgi:hypothetical protein